MLLGRRKGEGPWPRHSIRYSFYPLIGYTLVFARNLEEPRHGIGLVGVGSVRWCGSPPKLRPENSACFVYPTERSGYAKTAYCFYGHGYPFKATTGCPSGNTLSTPGDQWLQPCWSWQGQSLRLDERSVAYPYGVL